MGWTSTGKRAKPERKPELTIPEGGKIGQVLVMTENGLAWQDQAVVGTLTKTVVDGTDVWSCDKTFDELKAAWDNGKNVRLIYPDFGYVFSFFKIASNEIAFNLVQIGNMEDFADGYENWYVSIQRNGVLVSLQSV